MPDREKVIKELESMRDYHRSIGNNITADIADDALALLKEQEPVEPIKDEYGNQRCRRCGHKLHWDEPDVFCSKCGGKVKWLD